MADKMTFSRAARYLFGGVLAAVVLLLFWDPFFSGETLFSPDASPYYQRNSGSDAITMSWGSWHDNMLGQASGVRPLHPTHVLRFLLPALMYHVLSYVVDALLICLAAVYFLRGYGVHRAAALAAGIALGFSGYAFTLISAGHRGVVDTIPYAVFAFGLIDRALVRRSMFHFSMAGVCIAFGVARQPDVMVMFVLLIGVYGVYRFVRAGVALPRDKRVGYLAGTALGSALALVFFFSLAISSFSWVSKTVFPQRDDVRGKTPAEQWEFATDWSLPPEDMLEFVAPCVFGIETGDAKAPYWGRLGQSINWAETRQGLANLRQHTVYLGVLQLVFAFYAVLWGIRFRGRNRLAAEDEDHALSDDSSAVLVWTRADSIFWAAVVVVCLLLALGRYFILYRAFYSLPFLSKIRCPVKFIHLVNTGLCFLFGIGLAAFYHDLKQVWLARGPEAKKKASPAADIALRARLRTFVGFAALTGVCAVLLFFGAAVSSGRAAAFRTGWAEMGLDRFAPVMMESMVGALVHGGLLFALCAAVFLVARLVTTSPRVHTLIPIAILLVVAIDVVSVSKKYVRVRDVSAIYAPNPIADRILADGLNRTAFHLGPRSWRNWLWGNLAHHRVDMLLPRQETLRIPQDYTDFFDAMQRDPLRMWQITNTRFLLGTVQSLQSYLNHPAFEAVHYFNAVAGDRIRLTGPGQAPLVLLEYADALPRALVYHDWQVAARADVLTKLAAPDWDPSASAWVSGEVAAQPQAGVAPTAAEVVRHGNHRVVVEVETAHPGILALNDKYHPDWRVAVDGREAPLLACNHIMRGVELPAGRHRVVFTYRPHFPAFLLSVAACAIIAIWAGLRFVARRRATARTAVVVALVGLLGTGCGERPAPAAAPPITLGAQLHELTNVAAFAVTPAGSAHMVSTYDRSGGNEDWADWDPPGEDGLIELANLEGPGCVNRMWMTGGPERQWLFFFDGEKEPRIQVSMAELFGGKFPFVPPLADLVSAGRYNYVPIPFRRSLRIAIDIDYNPALRCYNQINYTKYPPGTPVESFPKALSAADKAAVEAVNRSWSDNTADMRALVERSGDWRTQAVPARGRATWFEQEGGGMLRSFRLRFDAGPDADAQAKAKLLREMVLKIYWDGADFPSVDVPVGDFFCNAFHRRSFSALPLAYVDNTYVCRFPMPFARSARAELWNDGATDVSLSSAVDVGALADGSAPNYFHAAWNGSTASRRPFRVMRATGRGHVVGCYLSAIGMDGTWTILEGDEAIRVDDEAVASIKGTGLEDYFNGAWYYTTLFDLPLHGLLEKASIRTDQYRFHLPERVPFNESLMFTFEFGDNNRARGYMSGVGYWYQAGPARTGSPVPVPVGNRFPPPDPFEQRALMGHLFELERVGFMHEARDRCREYAAKFPDSSDADVARLRALAYGERLDGLDSVRSGYEAMAKLGPDVPAGKQAADLLWHHEAVGNGLLGVHVNGRYAVYLDGKPVGQGEGAKDLDVYRVDAPPGPHELVAEVQPARPGSFISFHLRTRSTNVVSGQSWEYVEQRPPGWPRTADAGEGWQDLPPGRGILPTMYNMFLAPNAFVGMQSGKQTINLWSGWKREPKYRHVFLRKRFVVPQGVAAAELAPLRGVERSEDDQGVEGL